jgi:hypothetical protein
MGETGFTGGTVREVSPVSPKTVLAKGSASVFALLCGRAGVDAKDVTTGLPQLAQKRASAASSAPHLVQLAMTSVSHDGA